MIDPYQEIFEKIIELSNESGYATFDYLPDESQEYPFVYVGYQQNIDRITKTRFLGKTHIQLDVYAEHNRRFEVSRILNDLLNVIQHHRKTTHFTYTVVNSESQIVGDNTTDIPLIHGILELEIQYS